MVPIELDETEIKAQSPKQILIHGEMDDRHKFRGIGYTVLYNTFFDDSNKL